MIQAPRQLRLPTSLLALALFAGCAAKKQAGPALPPAEPPVAVASPEATPQASPTPAQQSQLPAQGTPPPEPDTPSNTNDTASGNGNDRKANAGKHASGKKPSPATREAAKTAPPKIVVRPDSEAPAGSGTISPGGPAATPNEPSTEQLLQTTESSLNSLNRQLSTDEQAMVIQIRDFITKSRNATRDNDNVGAHNFAVKAHLICDDLMKRR